MKIGIIKEGKNPPDSRVPLTPEQCASVQAAQPSLEIVVQPSPSRCYSDAEYVAAGVVLQENLSDCDVLMGVKEVPKEWLIADKTYFFFSHTIKKQPYNRALLQTILQKKIRLIDYEVLTDANDERLIAFGRFAGIVGAHNGVMLYGARTQTFHLPRMFACHDYAEAVNIYKKIAFPAMRIVLTGTGRVSQGAELVLLNMGFQHVSPKEYLSGKVFDEPIFTQLKAKHYARRKDGEPFEKAHFYAYPSEYESSFEPYFQSSDLMINGIYWDSRSPQFFTRADMKRADFRIKVIADVTCDMAPQSSIPSTLRATTIAEPVFCYQPQTEMEIPAYSPDGIDMMTIDNLPNELPRDASEFFGNQFIKNILGELMQAEHSDVIERATVTKNGNLTKKFDYLTDFVYE